jgi:flagellar hook assembly protein FlgD
VPVKFALGQNFPNPFNPSTIIPVSIPAAAQVKVVIYNTLGQEIITLFNGNLEVGRYYLVWDGTGNNHRKMPSGIYLYRLTTEKGLNLTGKMVLIK